MRQDPPTYESELVAVENEIAALKTSQPFYDGQFTATQMVIGDEDAVTIVTNHGTSFVDFFFEFTAPAQENPVFDPLMDIRDLLGNPLGVDKAAYIVHQEVSYNGTINVEVNIVTYGLAVGTSVVIKWGAIYSGNGTVDWSWELRP